MHNKLGVLEIFFVMFTSNHICSVVCNQSIPDFFVIKKD